MLVCIHFSNRSEAIFFYKSIVSEQKLWLLREFSNNYFEVRLESECMDGLAYNKLVQAFLGLLYGRKLLGWIEGVLKHNYHYEDQQEIQKVLEIGHEFKEKPPIGVNPPPVYSSMQACVKGYISGRKIISFDDLSASCLESLHEMVVEYTGILIDEYKLEEKHQLLVDSWRHRVHNKDTGVQLLHLIDTEGLHYYHAEGNEISHSETLLYMNQYPDQSINDLPLKWCVTPALVHAPDHLIIYSDQPGDAKLELLINIFEEKATLKPLADFPFEIS